MRPPASLQASTPASPANLAVASTPAADALPVLQGTRRNQQGTWLALLDGRWRAVGERHGDAVLSSVRATEVQMSMGSQRLTIKLDTAAPQPLGITPGIKQDRP